MTQCDQCTFLTAETLVDAKLQWGSFCTLPAYRDDQPAVEIHKDYACPLAEKENDST